MRQHSFARIFATIAENLGIHLERAEHLLEDYLDHAEFVGDEPPAKRRSGSAQRLPRCRSRRQKPVHLHDHAGQPQPRRPRASPLRVSDRRRCQKNSPRRPARRCY